MSRASRTVVMVIVIGGILLFSLLATLASLNRHDEVLGLNQEIQYDDFAFSVPEVRTTRTIGESTAQGIYFIVTVRVTNHAKRVNYEFKPTSPILVADHKQYHVSQEAQHSLEAKGTGDSCSLPIPPGSSCVKEVVFDLPPNGPSPQLRISTGGLGGDILDTIFYGKKLIRLDTDDQASLL